MGAGTDGESDGASQLGAISLNPCTTHVPNRADFSGYNGFNGFYRPFVLCKLQILGKLRLERLPLASATSGDDLLRNYTRHIRQPEIAAIVAIRQLLVIET
jgi:hypothetical protein